MKPSIDEIREKYRYAKREMIKGDLSSVKREIEAFLSNLRASDEKNEDLLDETEDMLIDLTKIIEEMHCQPIKTKILEQ
ncbi:MAG: hypothetical protein WED07_12110 [Candidatus Freyarchaeum deiterrae]